MAVTQAERQARVVCPLGQDVLLLRRMSGRETLGQVSEFSLDLLSEDKEIKAEDLLGKPMTVELDIEDGTTRYFHALVARFNYLGDDGRLAQYSAELRSWPWFLGLTADCHIFQDFSVPDLVKEVCKTFGFTDVDDTLLVETYPKYEYCVQYRETALNFIQRLLEREGIGFFFKHEDSKHTLVMFDDVSTLSSFSGHYDEVPYFPPDIHDHRVRDHLEHWTHQQQVQTGKTTLRSYDYLQPRTTIQGTRNESHAHEQAGLEVYDYSPRLVAYTTAAEGANVSLTEQHALLRLDEQQSNWLVTDGEGDARGLASGRTFSLTQYPREDQNRKYLILHSQYELRSNEYFSTGETGEALTWRCRISSMPSDRRYRPPRLARVPVVQGPQTAVVVGPDGEEIWTDEFGRVKVQFHWDRVGTNNEKSSCWIRVSQPWAGRNWGAIAIPRMGHEVIVDFIEGDPDRPIVTGRVYNAVNTVPYALPANKTQTGIKSRSSKEGTGDNFNEIRFEDKKGEEQVYIHAEKNQDIMVENDETHTVGHDRTKDIGNDETTHVGHDRTETVDNNETITVHANRTETVDINETISIGGNRTETVSGAEVITIVMTRTEIVGINEAVTVGGARELTVALTDAETIGATRAVTIGADHVLTIGSDETTKISKNRSHNIGEADTVTVGKDQAISVGKTHKLTVADEITIVTGEASINMKKDGTITIKGKDITLKGSGNINLDAGGKIVMKAQQILEN